METLISLLIVVLLLVLPLKFAAKFIGAKNTGFFACLFALIVSALFQYGVDYYFPRLDDTYDWLITVPVAALAYMLVLGTSFLKAVLIAIVQVILMVLLTALVAGLLAGI
ncbi:hypothetical protein [Kangiella koreensis]|uniref:Uncharacterized protein n=1 Tax=Kangiella koreensis (strain DSM 16069 / JCM 12317 / KCTC 12182 / SW-125) TaxID=523791 RepID=C7RAB5_KANKD|nr:hypothetical protein [Kangiella koreensis]ACV26234.1 hypothetical protein Kkor_0814 [Kangiella koreensis DSM 16069]